MKLCRRNVNGRQTEAMVGQPGDLLMSDLFGTGEGKSWMNGGDSGVYACASRMFIFI